MTQKTLPLTALAFLATTLPTAIPAVGILNALAMTAGAAAYGCLAAAITISTRLPLVERLFGPLDRAYRTHKKLGMSAVGLIVAHVALTLLARDISPLRATAGATPVIPLAVMGAVGLVLLLVAAASALNARLPYHRFQKVHGPAAGAAFTVLSIHSVVAVTAGPVKAFAPAAWTIIFVLVGMAGLLQRVLSRRPRPGHVITAVEPRERAIEITWEQQQTHAPGQFVVVTLDVDGQRESHPFTLTNDAGSTSRSVLVRASGDWTQAAQRGVHVGDRVGIEGPFGRFHPGSSRGPEIWLAGGAGITPFLSVLRTRAAQHDDDHSLVHLVLAAASAQDAPCWQEIRHLASRLPWLTVQPAFSGEGARLTPEAIDALASNAPTNGHWYACGPESLVAAARAAWQRAGEEGSRFHAESYSWR
ncbi:ferric reductase-like transmembrane domain-containing protein [Luteococcus peritonei]|uniref:Ferric reductase-like transmembrane domain-containing protein n=1 Tax=Luteococcus peritonei TaxID=88874 RepID=A0ABW4RZ98_9ACTN